MKTMRIFLRRHSPTYYYRFLVIFCLTATALAAEAVDSTPFPVPSSKKGLQVQMIDDALALGIKHAALNLNIAQLLDLSTNGLTANYNGRIRHFATDYVRHFDREIESLSRAGVVVSLILLNYESSDPEKRRLLLHPHYDASAPNHLSAFNTVTPEGAEAYSDCIEFIAQRYSGGAHGRVWNYIVGNEVNSHWFWSNMGRVTMQEFADDYLRAVRLCHSAVRKHSRNARVYLSLEHHWNIHYPGGDEQQTFAGRPFLDYFAAKAKEGGDFDWNVAFHPYPENLFECRTWNDKSAIHSAGTPRITFKNLEMLPHYLKQESLLYHGRPRRIILSEQGFHSPETAEGQTFQAAAYCYAWRKVQNEELIDSFIYHRHVDHGHEGGLNLGLWTRNKKSGNPAEPAEKKKIYEVFRAADTPEWNEAFRFALPVIGLHDWNELTPRRN